MAKVERRELTNSEWKVIEPLIYLVKSRGRFPTIDMHICNQWHSLRSENGIFMSDITSRFTVVLNSLH